MTVSHPTFEFEIHPMEVKQIYTGCLAQGAYYIESNGEAAIAVPVHINTSLSDYPFSLYKSN